MDFNLGCAIIRRPVQLCPSRIWPSFTFISCRPLSISHRYPSSTRPSDTLTRRSWSERHIFTSCHFSLQRITTSLHTINTQTCDRLVEWQAKLVSDESCHKWLGAICADSRPAIAGGASCAVAWRWEFQSGLQSELRPCQAKSR